MLDNLQLSTVQFNQNVPILLLESIQPFRSGVIDEELSKIASLHDTGEHDDAFSCAIKLVTEFPNEVRAHIAAAYASDRTDREQLAITHYETAFQMGIPDDERAGFLLGYGSTLRNIGRKAEAVEVLTEASRLFPMDAAMWAFLALAMHSAGHYNEAMANMLQAALMAARDDGFGLYSRALKE
jgi:Flp pilus assembly protein TadD